MVGSSVWSFNINVMLICRPLPHFDTVSPLVVTDDNPLLLPPVFT